MVKTIMFPALRMNSKICAWKWIVSYCAIVMHEDDWRVMKEADSWVMKKADSWVMKEADSRVMKKADSRVMKEDILNVKYQKNE